MARTDTTGTLACTSFNALASSTTTGFAETAARTTGTTANVFDAQVRVTVTVGAITPATTTVVNLYAYGAIDGTWPGGAATAARRKFARMRATSSRVLYGFTI